VKVNSKTFKTERNTEINERYMNVTLQKVFVFQFPIKGTEELKCTVQYKSRDSSVGIATTVLAGRSGF
jgi:hypothetical protein